jgi:hypothetical protein
MGGSLQGGQQVLASFHGNLKFNLKVGAEELETLNELVKERSGFKHQTAQFRDCTICRSLPAISFAKTLVK